MREWLEVCGSTIMAASQAVDASATSRCSFASSSTVAPNLRSEIAMILAGVILQKREGKPHDAGR